MGVPHIGWAQVQLGLKLGIGDVFYIQDYQSGIPIADVHMVFMDHRGPVTTKALTGFLLRDFSPYLPLAWEPPLGNELRFRRVHKVNYP